VELVVRAALVFAREGFGFLGAYGAVRGGCARALVGVCGAGFGFLGGREGSRCVVLGVGRAGLGEGSFVFVFDLGLEGVVVAWGCGFCPFCTFCGWDMMLCSPWVFCFMCCANLSLPLLFDLWCLLCVVPFCDLGAVV
jgi:hypothetical protein